jgi:hypothetical protein
MSERKAVTRETGREYQNAGKKEKGLILDHLVRLAGYNRKHAIRVPSTPFAKMAAMAGDGKTAAFKAEKSRDRKTVRVNRSTPKKPSPARSTSGGFTGTNAAPIRPASSGTTPVSSRQVTNRIFPSRRNYAPRYAPYRGGR